MPPLSSEEIQIKVAVLERDQARAEALGTTILAKLETIQRDLSDIRDRNQEQIERLHDRITQEKKAAHDEIWQSIRRHEELSIQAARELNNSVDENREKIDASQRWLLTMLTTTLLSVALAVFSAFLSWSHVAPQVVSSTPHP
jgi:predicted PurR-regulated permease PerM